MIGPPLKHNNQLAEVFLTRLIPEIAMEKRIILEPCLNIFIPGSGDQLFMDISQSANIFLG